jgi:hypothetical protein
MEEFFRKAVEKYKEILKEIRRVALADKETVKKVDEMRKNGDCVACHSENNTNKQQPVSTSNKEQNNKSIVVVKKQNNKQLENNNSPGQIKDNINVDKATLIAQLKREITELKKNLNSDEKKTLLAQKEAKLAELESNNKQNKVQEVSGKNNNSKENNLTSILLPVGIISASLLALSAFWIVKKRKK